MLGEILKEIDLFNSSTDIDREENFLLRYRALESASIARETGSYLAADELEKRILNINESICRKYRKLFSKERLPQGEIRRIINRFSTCSQKSSGNIYYSESNLDLFIDCIFNIDVDSVRIGNVRSGMVHLERSPADAVLEFIDHLDLSGTETVYDLGSGLGHVLFLFRLLTGAKCIGIEIEHLYYDTSVRIINSLNVDKIQFINKDVRDVDLSKGNIFFMYSPFFDTIMDEVLKNLKVIGRNKKMCICSFGNSTRRLNDEKWLNIEDKKMLHPYKAAIFNNEIP
jgi:hypothetical protein